MRAIDKGRLFWNEDSIGPQFPIEVFVEQPAAEEFEGRFRVCAIQLIYPERW